MAFAAAPFLIAGGISAIGKKIGNAALVAAIVAAFTHMFRTKLGMFVVGAMLWMGINFASMKMVIEPAITVLLDYANPGSIGSGSAGELAMMAVAWLGVLNLDRAVTMIVSAVITRHAVQQAKLFLTKAPIGTP
mgnify:CR=1 FL=1